MRKLLTVLVLLTFAATAFYFFYWESERGDALRARIAGDAAAQNMSDDHEITGQLQVRVTRTYADSYRVARVAGDIVNNADEDCQLARIRFELLDRDNHLMKTMEANIRDIPAGQSRTFDIEVGVYRGSFKADAQVVGAAF